VYWIVYSWVLWWFSRSVLEEELACGEDLPRGSVADEVLLTGEEGDRSEAVSPMEGPTRQPLGVVLPW
jgi:hypothetical protein